MNAAYSDPELLQKTLELSKTFNLTTFFETGTFHGMSSQIISNYFDKVMTVENNEEFYQIAVDNLKNINNCSIYFGNSPEIMDLNLKNNNSSIFFFLDAHWYDYWPILDELEVIYKKSIQPVIAIHDFYVPDSNGNAKFGFDSYHDTALDFNYIKSSIDKIYDNKYEISYSTTSTTNSGVIFIYPQQSII